MAVQIIIRNPLDRDARDYMARAGVTDAAARTQINEFVRGMRSLGLWDKFVCWPLRSTQNAGAANSDTVYSLGGLGTFNGTRVNGPTWEANGMQFATDATTNRNRRIDVPWSTVGGYDCRANSTVVVVSNFGVIAGTNVDQYLFGANTNNCYMAMNTRSSGGTIGIYSPSNQGQDNLTSWAAGALSAEWRMWTTQRENNDGANSNTSGNKLYENTTLRASGSNAAKAPWGAMSSATETNQIGNAASSTVAPIGKIAFVAVIADWTASVSAIRSLYVSTLGQGVLT